MEVEFQKFESDGRFGLVSGPGGAYGPDDGSLGRGGGETTYYFLTEEGRSYFIRAEQERYRADAAQRELAQVKFLFEKLLTPGGRLRRKVLKQLADRLAR